MSPDLSERERERFRELRERLEGVSRAAPPPTRVETRPGPLDPMLATSFDGDIEDLPVADWIGERKYDGTRLLLEKFDGDVALYTRRHVERSETLPELTAVAAETLPDGLILDGEYTYLDPEGVSQFIPIHTGAARIADENLRSRYFVFDILASDHEWCVRDPLMERKDRLADVLPDEEKLSIGAYETGDLQAYYDELVASGEEGLIVKRRGSGYHLGTRSEHWKKVKSFKETKVLAVGYTAGEGARATTFGALVMTDGARYLGRVGSGFSEAELELLLAEVAEVDERPVSVDDVGEAYTPIEPLVIEVKYQDISDSNKFRAPVFLRYCPDVPIDDIEPIETSGDQ